MPVFEINGIRFVGYGRGAIGLGCVYREVLSVRHGGKVREEGLL